MSTQSAAWNQVLRLPTDDWYEIINKGSGKLLQHDMYKNTILAVSDVLCTDNQIWKLIEIQDNEKQTTFYALRNRQSGMILGNPDEQIPDAISDIDASLAINKEYPQWKIYKNNEQSFVFVSKDKEYPLRQIPTLPTLVKSRIKTFTSPYNQWIIQPVSNISKVCDSIE